MRLMIAGGGTGGHVYPGVAVARTWLADSSNNEVLFVGPKKGLLSKILEREGLPIKSIKASGFVGVRIGKKILSILQLISGLFQSLEIIKTFNPHVVLGVGGYASVSPIIAAWLKRKPIVLIEQNSVPGIANRILSPFASKIALGFIPPPSSSISTITYPSCCEALSKIFPVESLPFFLRVSGASMP